MHTPTAISPSAAEFGIAPGGAATALSSLQAGAHADLTSVINFDTINAQGATAGDPKDATVELPPGFAGDLPDIPSCPAALFSDQECPIATQVGVTTMNINLGSGPISAAEPLYHLAPGPGEVAKIGFHAIAFNVVGDVSLRPGGSGLQTSIRNIPGSSAQLDSASISIWGVPADPLHNPMRWNPTSGEFGASSEATPAAYFTNPTSCSSEALRATLSVDSWENPTPAPANRNALRTASGLSAVGPGTDAQRPTHYDRGLLGNRPWSQPLGSADLPGSRRPRHPRDRKRRGRNARRGFAQPLRRCRPRRLHAGPICAGSVGNRIRPRLSQRFQGWHGADQESRARRRSDRGAVSRQALRKPL